MEKENDIKARAVMDFVNMMIGALEAGFIETNATNLSEIYQVARNHIKDNYKIDVPCIAGQWGNDTAVECGLSRVLTLSTDKKE